MILFSIPDIRLFWSIDSRFLSQFEHGKITTFKPYSKYPSCFKDVSFWSLKDQLLHENDFCDLVRDVAGDIVEDVKKVGICFSVHKARPHSILQIDEFVHPKTGRISTCFRINYRSMDRYALPSSFLSTVTSYDLDHCRMMRSMLFKLGLFLASKTSWELRYVDYVKLK